MAERKPRKPKLRLDVQPGQHGLPASALGPKSGLTFVQAYFPLAKSVLRIATGYFSVKGYNIGLENLTSPDILLHFLVGPKEGKNARDAVAQRIRLELRSGDSGNLVAAVEDLIERIKAGKFVIQDTREVSQMFHCKFYVCDEEYVWHGSANFTENGLLRQAEQVEASTDPDLIQRWLTWFREVANQSRNIMAEVLAELEGWLKLAEPFEAYLKALLVLFGLPETPYLKGAHQPTYYQQALIAWTLRRLAQYNGALLVVTTGLGKTVIGAELANRLNQAWLCNTILLVAPPTVHRAWKKQLVLTRKLPAHLFGCNALFNGLKGKMSKAASELNAQLQNADEKTLILIDEAHYYRNELLAIETKHVSEVYERLRPALAQGAKIVLLTGSVYGTNMQNPNSLLALLPPRPATDPDEGAIRWKVDSCEQLVKLPIVSVLGIPHVLKMARQRKDVDAEQHPFIEFSDKNQRLERNYLPRKIHSRLISFKPMLLHQVVRVIDGKCCDRPKPLSTKTYEDEVRKFVNKPTDSILDQATYSWLSSPPAFARRLRKNLQTPGQHEEQFSLEFVDRIIRKVVTQGRFPFDEDIQSSNNKTTKKATEKQIARTRYKGELKLSRAERQLELEPILKQLSGSEEPQDDKLNKLKQLINERCRVAKSKVIIFVEYYETAVYLEKKLLKQFASKVRVACTVFKKGETYSLKSVTQRQYLQGRFAPKANEQKEPGDYDVLICTDADGVGVNLQDADTVIELLTTLQQ